MYITKSGVIQKIDEDAWPSWRDEGWAIDQDRDGTPDSLSGGGDTSGLLPIADPTGVTSETSPNTIKGSGTIGVVTVPADTTVFAVKLEGDDYARIVINADPTDWGAILLGDGTFDPLTGGANIYYAAEGLWLSSGGSKAVNFNSDIAWPSGGGGPVLQDNGDGLFYRATLASGVLTWVLVT